MKIPDTVYKSSLYKRASGKDVIRSACLAILMLLFSLAGCGGEDTVDRLRIGGPAPDFTIEDLAGKPFRLSGLAGKPVIIRFFIVDCQFCKADTPIFNNYYAKYKEKGLAVIYITSTTNRQQVERFTGELKIPFQVGIDYGKVVANKFHVEVEPQTILLDRNHVIKAAILGGVTEPELDEVLGGEWE